MGKLPAAAADEEAELRALGDRAEQSRLALAGTADALARAMSPARQATSVRHLTVIAVPALVVLAAATVYLLRRHPR
jgi:hypothetical protein